MRRNRNDVEEDIFLFFYWKNPDKMTEIREGIGLPLWIKTGYSEKGNKICTSS